MQVAYFAKCAVRKMQAARRPAKTLVYFYVGKWNAEIGVLAGNDEIFTVDRQFDDANARRAPVEVVGAKHVQTIRAYKAMSKSNAVAASSPTAPIASGSAATNSCRSLAGNNRTDSS